VLHDLPKMLHYHKMYSQLICLHKLSFKLKLTTEPNATLETIVFINILIIHKNRVWCSSAIFKNAKLCICL